MKFTNRADLLIAAGESITMQEKAGIEPLMKCAISKRIETISTRDFRANPEFYEFPLAVVEGKPVFVGDELYDQSGIKYVAGFAKDQEAIWAKPGTPFLYGKSNSGNLYFCQLENAISFSWNPTKPKTVMVELLREDAEHYSRFAMIDQREERFQAACRKALEAA